MEVNPVVGVTTDQSLARIGPSRRPASDGIDIALDRPDGFFWREATFEVAAGVDAGVVGNLGMGWLSGAETQRQFAAFAAAVTDGLVRSAYLMTGNLHEAEDLVQETLIRVARRWPKVDAMDHPEAYARKILINLVIDGVKHRTRRKEELGSAVALERRGDERGGRAAAGVEAASAWAGALAQLSRRQRAVIVLRYWDDWSEAEVAAVLGCTVGTVKSTASRGLARLRDLMNAPDASETRSAP